MRASRHTREPTLWRAAIAALALAAICGAFGAHDALAQDAAQEAPPLETPADEAPIPERAPGPPQPIRIMSWNVATSPYAIAMRKIKSEPPAWRTSFGAERRTIEAPPRPQASDIKADIVLLQGVINPRAMRRLFPAREWRLILSPRALETLPKGSVFTAPVSSVEIEAIAVRYREGRRIIGRGEPLDTLDAAQTAGTPADNAGLAIRIVENDRTLWIASATLPPECRSGQACAKAAALERWRASRQATGNVIIGGGLKTAAEPSSCSAQSIEITGPAGPGIPQSATGAEAASFGCAATLTLE